MGRAKEELMRQQELEPMYEWIEENYGDDAGEEGTEEWEAAIQAYEDYCDALMRKEEEWYLEDELGWYVYTQSELGKFDVQIQSVLELVEIQASDEAQFSLLVMLHSHIVAAVESYLASVFIHKVTNSEDLIRRLVETDPAFSKKRFTLKEIYEKHENLQFTVALYLKNLIFHDFAKVKPMFKEVLDCDFGDINWFFKAVHVRHHCVHRAGHHKDGTRVELSKASIRSLASKASDLAHSIEKRLLHLSSSDLI